MKILIKQIVPYTCISTTLVLLITSIYNIFQHNDVSYYTRWLVMIGGVFLLYTIQFEVLGRISIKNLFIHEILVYLLWYIGLGIVIYGTHWMGLRISNVVRYTIIMTGCSILIGLYGRKQTRVLADEINAMMENNKNGRW